MSKLKRTKHLPLVLILSVIFFNFSFLPIIQNCKQSFHFLESFSFFNQKKSQAILEIDSRSVSVVEEMGGGIYYRQVDAIVPFFPDIVNAEWLKLKNSISKRIGYIGPGPSKKTDLWRNNANSIDLLIEDAKLAAPHFLKMCEVTARKTGTLVNFGINNQHMIKSKKSLKRKIRESLSQGDSEEDAVRKVRDSLRGTIIAEIPEQIPLIVHYMKEYARTIGSEAVFINIWEENRSSGYVGVHVKILFPIFDENGIDTGSKIIAEIQIHLRCIMDGTKHSVKEREHLLYEQMMAKGVDPKIQTAASKLLYLTALMQCPSR